MLRKNKIVNDFEKSNLIYFKEIAKLKTLSKDEELKLFLDYKNNRNIESRNRLITSNLKFVATVARKYQGRGLSFSDLISEGNAGLIKAIDKFDESKNVKIISYSVWWIRQSILEAIEKRNGVEGEEIPNEISFINDDADDSPCPSDKVDKDYKYFVLSDLEDFDFKSNEMSNALSIIMSNLTDRERFIVKEYYGFDDGEPKTLEEIGNKLHLTKERIRQIKNKAFKKMRSNALKNYITSDIYK